LLLRLFEELLLFEFPFRLLLELPFIMPEFRFEFELADEEEDG
jgi:hypothetical protein